MSIREAVTYLANDLRTIAVKKEPSLVPTIDALARISDDLYEKALDDWEDLIMEMEVPSHINVKDNKTYIATETIFAFGRSNMYSSFNRSYAEEYYKKAADSINDLRMISKRIKEFNLSNY